MYRWAEHTGELELEIEAQAEAAVYEQAVLALAGLLDEEHDGDPASGPAPASGEGMVRDVAVEAPDRARLLAEFLGELAFLAETERFVPRRIERLAQEAGRLQATVRGHAGDPPHLVKAVTYHRLTFEPAGGGWRARVVLDV